jgi:hypothetical protein
MIGSASSPSSLGTPEYLEMAPTSTTQSNEYYKYFKFQMKLAFYTMTFWSVVLTLIIHKNELKRLKSTINALIYKAIQIRIDNITNLNYYKERFKNYVSSFEITTLQGPLRKFRQTISRLYEFLINNPNNPNSLAKFLLMNLKSILNLIRNISCSLSSLTNAFSFNIKRVLLVPSKVGKAYRSFSLEVRRFWIQIEQIIQIVRLPIEILSLIGRFIKSVGNFLQRLEKPRMPKVI